MDPPERIVLRRKKLMLSMHFTLNDKQLERILQAKLLKRTEYDAINAEPTNIGRVGRLVDVLPVEGFGFFCDLLAEHNEWLSDELKTELKAELGQLEVEDYINKESAVLVHREFGASKRLAQGEKLKLCGLVAARTQFAKEVWRHQIQRARDALEETKAVNAEKDFRAQNLATRIHTFLMDNRERLQRPDLRKHKGKAPSQDGASATSGSTPQEVNDRPTPSPRDHTKKVTLAVPEEPESRPRTADNASTVGDDPTLVALAQLSSMMEEVITLIEECYADREGLRAERRRLLETLKLEEDDELTPVDLRLKELLANANAELDTARDKVKFREERTTELEHRLHEYWIESEKTLESKDEQIKGCQEKLKKLEETVNRLDLSVKKKESELRCARNELKQYKDRTATLERNRRLGYKTDQTKTSAAGATGGVASTRFPSIKDGDRSVPGAVSRGKRVTQATPWQVIENKT